MNIYAIIIATALLASYTLNLIADILNLKGIRKELPDEFKDVCDETAYRKSQDYLRANTRFGLITHTVDLIVLFLFWFLGGFNFVDQIVRGLGYGSIVTGLVYIGILIVAQGALSFPFSLYHTFVLEEKFGFNKTTLGTFMVDQIKGIVLGVVLGAPLLAGILWFFDHVGPSAWLWCWLCLTVVTLALQYIAPTWIMPLFNKFTPLEDGDLKRSILSYAESVKFPLSGVYVIDGSKRSTKSNAFFTGFGKNKRIALYDTLIENHTVPELVAVLAHEIGHYKRKHIVKSMALGMVQTGIIFFLLSIFLTSEGLFEAFFMEKMSIYAGLIFFGLLYTPADFIISLFMHIFSRKNEYEADRYVSETYQMPEALADALKKLSVNNLSNLTPHPFYVFMNYSHPPVLSRIEAIRSALPKRQNISREAVS
ncbi:MAG: M48 family metallopeptidase, partial [Chlorobiales bacterium]|nr:M48 family metallopeptidase [Chlorobiales bacterium]